MRLRAKEDSPRTILFFINDTIMNMNYYIVGGAVRDLLLGRALRDADFLFDGAEEEFIQRNPSARKVQSGAFPIYLLDGHEFTPLGQFGRPLEERLDHDLKRRDFTINAMALSPQGELHCHPAALYDLRAKLLRPASPYALAADPARAFRAARMSALLPDFSLHPETLAQMRAAAAAGGFKNIAAERIGRECAKACRAARPGNFLRTLHRGGCLVPWFAEFSGADSIPAGPPVFHDASVLEHTARVMDAVPFEPEPGEEENALSVWMALCHDLGKTSTPGDLLPHHYGHEERGKTLAEALGRRLRLPGRWIAAGRLCALLHMKAALFQSLRPGTRVDLLTRLHAARLIRPLFRVAEADSGQKNLLSMAEADLALILPVSLSPAWQNKGAESGRRLRDLRCMALERKSSGLETG